MPGEQFMVRWRTRWPFLPGEVLISRTAVMAPASRDGAETGEEPDLVLGSNREVVVEDVTPERCDLAEFWFCWGDADGTRWIRGPCDRDRDGEGP